MDNDQPVDHKKYSDDLLPMPTEPLSLHAPTHHAPKSESPMSHHAPIKTVSPTQPEPETTEPEPVIKQPDQPKDRDLAVDVIRKKVEEAFKAEPTFMAEVKELEKLPQIKHLSTHQLFIEQLLNSGQTLESMQTHWHAYYAGLNNDQKHEVWREFYANQPEPEHYQNLLEPEPKKHHRLVTHQDRFKKLLTDKKDQRIADFKSSVVKKLPTDVIKYRPPKHIRSILFGLMAGTIAIMIMLFSFFNEQIIAPFIQPSRHTTNIPLISDSAIGPNPAIIIPKINVEIPVVYDVETIDETAIAKGLENGVVHYADTPMPGQNGNLVIVGHSSNNIFNKGKYKFAFVLLNRLEIGDTFYLQKDGKRYTYQIYKRSVVEPSDVSVLGTQDSPATASLITCDPPGTSLKRLVVVGKQISPDPLGNTAPAAPANLATQTKTVPGNSPSLWHNIWKALSR